MKFSFFLISLFFISTALHGQATGDFRSHGTGSWSAPANWDRYNGTTWINPAPSTPTGSSGTITIQSPHNITMNVAITLAGTLVINSGGTLTISNSTGTDLTVNGTLTDNGTLSMSAASITVVVGNGGILQSTGTITGSNATKLSFNSGASYNHLHTTTAGVIPTATWSSGSTCSVLGYTTNAASPSGLTQSFSNFIWNTPSLTQNIDLSNALTTVGGNLSITVPSGVTVDLGNSGSIDLSVDGDFTVAGSGTVLFTGGTLHLTGTSLQTISGTIDLDNIDIGPSTTALVQLAAGASIGLKGTLTLNGSSTFDADGSSGTGNFTLISSALGTTGNIAQLPDPTNFSGNVTVQRFINTPEDWRYLCFPVSGANVGMLQDNILVTGNFSDPSTGGNVTNSTSPSIYNFDAPTQTWTSVGTGGSVASTSLSGTTGYSIWSYVSSNAVIDVSGSIGKGDVGLSISTGDNLLPNPYPSDIDWDAVDFTGANLVTNAVYRRTALNTYDTYITGGPSTTNSNLVSSGQAFWVIGGGSGTLTFHETNKSTGGSFMRKEKPSDYLTIKMSKGNLTDKVFVHFRQDATLDKDVKFDALKKLNGVNFNLSLYNTNATVDYAINAVPFLNCSFITNLKIGSSNPVGSYSLGFSDLVTLSRGYSVTLIDKFLNSEKVVTEGMSYPFEITANPSSKGSDRFKISFKSSLTPPTVIASGNMLSVPGNLGTYQWYKNDQLIEGAITNTYIAAESGTYRVKLTGVDCEVSSDNFTFTITGFESNLLETYSLFPNPTVSDDFKLSGPHLDKSQIHIFDNLGRDIEFTSKIIESGDGGESCTVNLEGHGRGVYMVKVVNGKKSVRMKLIKN